MEQFIYRIKLVLKQWFYRLLVLPYKSQDELYGLMRQPDSDLRTEVWKAFIRRLTSISQLMVIVYDDDYEYDEVTRLWAGRCALQIIRQWSPAFVPRSCPSWINPEQGRLAYLVGVGLFLPRLQALADSIVCQCFTLPEQWAFEESLVW